MSRVFLLGVILFAVLFLIVSGGIAAIIVTGIVRKKRNDRAAQTTVDASVLEKNTTVQRHPVAGDTTGAHGYTRFTSRHVTFLTADDAQRTFEVDETVYDALTEGDRGRLTYQGSRFVGFVRSV